MLLFGRKEREREREIVKAKENSTNKTIKFQTISNTSGVLFKCLGKNRVGSRTTTDDDDDDEEKEEEEEEQEQMDTKQTNRII